jgi:4-hydroxy-3-polyprenylbenzoate decarboxylase
MKIFCLAITGASGVIYGIRTAEALLETGAQVHLIVSAAAQEVLRQELTDYGDGYWSTRFAAALREDRFFIYDDGDIGAAPASGSWAHDGMLIVPCSMHTLAAVAQGLADSLITRAAGVALKENRRLVLAPRETPLSAIHLQNMLTLAQNRALIVPAMPGFYNHPAQMQDLIDFVVGKILAVSGVEHPLIPQYHRG